MPRASGPRGRQPCHCGSGRRYNACCRDNDGKPRIFGATFVPTRGGYVTGVQLGPNGQVRLMSGADEFAVTDVRVAEWRATAKGLKPKSQVVSDQMFLNTEVALSGMEYIFGIDTNEVEIGCARFNISCMTCATRASTSGDYAGSIRHLKAIDFVDDAYKAERVGWIFALAAMRASGLGNAPIALCTDHDISAHESINSGSQPIIDDIFLPHNVTLVYANDRGSAMTNKLIGAAHKGAKQVEKLLRDQSPEPQLVLDYLLGRSAAPPPKRIWNTASFSAL